LSITCRALENAEENDPTTQAVTPTIQKEDLTDKQSKHTETSDDMWHEVQPETVTIKRDEKSKRHENLLEPSRKHSESESSTGLWVKRKQHETSNDGSSNDDFSDDDVLIRRKYKTREPIIKRKPKHIMRRKHKVRGWRKKFHRRKLKIVPQLPPTYRLLNAIQIAASNPRYRASQVIHPTSNSHQIMVPYTKGVSPFNQY
jgi:hypothetical protein